MVAFLPLPDEAQPAGVLRTVMPNIKAALGSPGPILLALAFGIYTFQYAAMANLLPTLLVDRLGLSIAAAGTISAITVAANAVGNVFAGALLRFGAPFWAVAAFAYCFVGVAGFGVFSENLPVVLIAALASASLGGDRADPGLDLRRRTALCPHLRPARDRARPAQPDQQSRQSVRTGGDGHGRASISAGAVRRICLSASRSAVSRWR